MANWNERDQDWRSAQGWRRESGGARESFGSPRYEQGQAGGYNAGGGQGDFGRDDQRNYGRSGYGQGGYGQGGHDVDRSREDRSFQSGGSDYRYEDGFNDAGPAQRWQGGQDEHRYGGRGGGQGSRGQDYGRDQSNRYYGAEWSDRDSYDARRGDHASGGGRNGRDNSGGDYVSGGYGEYGQSGRGSQLGTVRDTGFGDPNPYVQAAADGERQGQHRGRGPSDYRRSDDRIREDVNDRLTDDAHIDASGIQVAVKDGEVTLSGTVDSRFAKRHAEDLAERISGARHVQNNLRVRDNDSRQASSYGSTSTSGSSASATGGEAGPATTSSSTTSGRA